MGYLTAGLFGEVRNKIGGVIFSNWKGINTAREYKVPANPNTTAQQTQRAKFKKMVEFAQALMGTLIATFLNPFAVKMSGFNYLISLISPDVTSAGLLTENCQVTKGTLEVAPIDAAATYNPITGDLNIFYKPAVSGNGLSTDFVNALAVNKTDNTVLAYLANGGDRVDETLTITAPSGLTATNVLVYYWLSRGTGSSFMVSNSIGQVCGAE